MVPMALFFGEIGRSWEKRGIFAGGTLAPRPDQIGPHLHHIKLSGIAVASAAPLRYCFVTFVIQIGKCLSRDLDSTRPVRPHFFSDGGVATGKAPDHLKTEIFQKKYKLRPILTLPKYKKGYLSW
jgi:hypothetical protein